MSLILDALQQAETERGTGSAPDLFAPVPSTAHPATVPATTRHRWVWPTIALLLGGALIWALWRLQAPDHSSASLTAQPISAPTTAPAPAPAPAAAARPDPSPAVTGADAVSAAGALFRPAPLPPAPPAAEREGPKPVAATTPPNAAAPTVSSAQTAPPAATAATAAPAVPTVAPPPAAPLADMNAAQRAGLPPLQITGHTYSDNPTLRMLMVDGHMVVEGQAIAPGLRLERIGPHQAIFNHRGTRFSVGY